MKPDQPVGCCYRSHTNTADPALLRMILNSNPRGLSAPLTILRTVRDCPRTPERRLARRRIDLDLEDRRRQGWAAAYCERSGSGQLGGARYCYLQVASANTAATGAYERLGSSATTATTTSPRRPRLRGLLTQVTWSGGRVAPVETFAARPRALVEQPLVGDVEALDGDHRLALGRVVLDVLATGEVALHRCGGNDFVVGLRRPHPYGDGTAMAVVTLHPERLDQNSVFGVVLELEVEARPGDGGLDRAGRSM